MSSTNSTLRETNSNNNNNENSQASPIITTTTASFFEYTGQPKSEIPLNVTHVSIMLDDSVEIMIPDGTFQGFTWLEDVKFVSAHNNGGGWKLKKTIGKHAFSNCILLKSVIFPITSLVGSENNAIITVQPFAFSDCTSLMEMDLRGFKSIQDIDCHSLQEIKIPRTVKVIGQGAFENCKNLRNLILLQRSDDDDDNNNNETASSSLEIIGNEAFKGCSGLVELLLPSTVVTIGNEAFMGASSLTSLVLPEGLLSLGKSAFSSCSNLWFVSIPSTLNKIEQDSFSRCLLAEVQFQEGLDTIGARAFFNNPLDAIAFPRSLSLVENGAFLGCGCIQGVEIPMHTDLHIGRGCFGGCEGVVNLCIPTTMTQSAVAAFSDCMKIRWRYPHERFATFRPEILRKRFVNLPVHEVCYYASSMTVNDLSLALESQIQECIHDTFGMTPFHIVVTSARLHEGMLKLLLDRLPVDFIWIKDMHKRTMMDYLLWRRTKRSVPLIKMVLQKVIQHEASVGGVSDKGWMSDLSRRVHEIPVQNYVHPQIKEQVDSVVREATRCLGMETTSIVELAIWKLAICHELPLDDQEDPVARTECRMRCGSEIVIGNAMGYLWHLKDGVPLPATLCSSLYRDALLFDGFEEEEEGDY